MVQPVAAANLGDVFGAFMNMGNNDPELLALYDKDENGVVDFGDLILLLQEILALGGRSGIICISNSECGGTVQSSNFCDVDNLMYNVTENICLNPGVVESSCDSNVTAVLVQNCPLGCSEGSCLSGPGNNFTCESTDPEIILQSYALPYNPPPQCIPYESSTCARWGGADASNNPLGVFVLQNNTGGNILIIDVNNGGYSVYESGCQNSKYFTPLFVNGTLFAAITDTQYSVSVPAGENINIEKIYLTLDRFEPGNPCLVNQYPWPTTHRFPITYRDQFGVDNSFEVVCHNFPPTS